MTEKKKTVSLLANTRKAYSIIIVENGNCILFMEICITFQYILQSMAYIIQSMLWTVGFPFQELFCIFLKGVTSRGNV